MGRNAGQAHRLFGPEELGELTAAIAAARSTADLAARAKVRQRLLAVQAQHDIAPADVAEGLLPPVRLLEDVAPMPPERALAYFLSLVPKLGVKPERFGPEQRRRAFTLAVATSNELLAVIQSIIADRLATGEGISSAPRVIAQVLDQAGVSPRNPQYAEMVFRTNTMDAYNTAATQEQQDPDVIETFPVWQYANPDDSRSRPLHAERDGKYYPAAVPFVKVRGTDIANAANCRCTFIPIDKWEWARLVSQGVRIADGYPDVPATAN